jgi:hypothetical protein
MLDKERGPKHKKNSWVDESKKEGKNRPMVKNG